MAAPRLLAVPNVSEGRDPAAIERIAAALAAEALVLDRHSDSTHNRTVLTLAPLADPAGALTAAARAAIEAIDMRSHEGEHPCIGALDVSPVVYLEPDSREEARTQALIAAERIAALEVPVFLYGALAVEPERRERAHFRGGGIETLARRMRAGELVADFGPAEPHPTAGATLVTARAPLAAFNLELDGVGIDDARLIAAGLREAGGGLPGVRAIGLDLGDGRMQISTNVHDPIAIPLAEVVERTGVLTSARGGRVAAAEIVGLVPRAAMAGFPPDLPIHAGERKWDPAHGQIEDRIAALA
ncbi:glutamate formimidoyltransferase [soil metagenome]